MATIDPELMQLLACPCDAHGELKEAPEIAQRENVDGVLQCSVCDRAFPVRDGIPVLLLDEAL